ncbi:MAG: Mu-like prophage major head subunit gpT family protein [bacterium]
MSIVKGTITAAMLASIYKTNSALFNQAMEITQVYWPAFASLAPSTSKTQDYAWLGAFPMLREWLGDRVLQNLMLHGYSITNKDYEGTIEIDRNDILDDNIGVYKSPIQELGRSSKVHPDYLLAGLLAAGFTTICYDGQYFFDTDHPVGSSTVSNYGGGAGTAWYLFDTSRFIKPLIYQERQSPQFVAMDSITDENVFMRKKYRYGVDYRGNVGYGLWQLAYASKDTLDATNYAAARSAMMAFKNDNGVPLGIMPDLLVYPPSLDGNAREILLAERNQAGATNVYYNTAKPLCLPWLS